MSNLLSAIFIFAVFYSSTFAQVMSNRVVATLNNEPVTLLEVRQEWLISLLENESITDYITPNQEQLKVLLEAVIEDRLLLSYADKKELQIDDITLREGVNKRLEILYARLKDYPLFKQYAENLGLDNTSLPVIMANREKSDMILAHALKNKLNISQSELDTFTAELQETGQPLSRYHLMQIYLTFTPETREKQVLHAYRIMDMLKSGMDFKQIALKYSEGSAASRGGDLGYLDSGKFDPMVENVVKDAEPRNFYGPIIGKDSIRIIYLKDKIESRDLLLRRKYKKVKDEFMMTLRGDYSIRIML